MHLTPLTREMGMVVTADAEATESVPLAEDILSLVRSHGVAVFRGFAPGLARFYELAAQISPGVHRGVGEDTNGLRLHGEIYYMPLRVDLLWFYCVSSAPTGGATTVCDGVQVADQLSVAARQFFADNPLTYELHFTRSQWSRLVGNVSAEQAAQLLRTDVMGPVADAYGDGCTFSCAAMSAEIVRAVFGRSAIIPTQWNNRRAFVNTMLHALDPWASSRNRHMYRLTTRIPPEILSEVEQVTERLTEEIWWSPGDFAVVDNTRLMHGRRAYEGPRNIQAINGVLPANAPTRAIPAEPPRAASRT
jgi:hypothetical protein